MVAKKSLKNKEKQKKDVKETRNKEPSEEASEWRPETTANNEEKETLSRIYTRFVELVQEQGGLSKEHRQELLVKRGLTQATIQQACLLSADTPVEIRQNPRRQINASMSALCQDFSKDELVKAGLLREIEPSKRQPEGGHEIVRQLTNGGIIIPYLDEKGEKVLYLRAHKYGPKNIDLELYGLNHLQDNPEQIVITEGEFKALALQQCGIPAIATPGIAAFGGKHFKRLVLALTRANVRKVIVLFDNEIKNDPAFPSYKENPLSRWDTDYWACRIARQLYTQEGIDSALIARFPDDWRIDGKIDPDGALAFGRTPEELKEVIASATIAKKYLTWLPQEGQIVTSYRLAKDRLHFSSLKEEQGIYKWSAGENTQELSNFTLAPKHQRRRATGILERIFVATNTLGESREVILSPNDLGTLGGFVRCIENEGNFIWRGNNIQLSYLKERLFLLLPPRVAEETESFGRQKDGSWVFGDAILAPATQRAFSADEDGIIWQGEGLNGLLPLLDEKDPAPKMHVPEKFEPSEKELPKPSEIYEALRDTYGSPGAGLVLGWSLACIFSDEIYTAFGHFPILGLFAEKGAGKSRIADLIRCQWGDDSGGVGRCDLSKMSHTAIGRMLAKYRSLPLFLDEFRNNLGARKEVVIRSIYDRSPLRYGEKSNDLRTVGHPIRACAILAGEEIPSDPALRSRCIEVPIIKRERNPGHFDECNKLMKETLSLVRWSILRSTTLGERVITCINLVKTKMHLDLGSTRDERILETYAVSVGALAAIAVELEGEKCQSMGRELMEWVTGEVVDIQSDRDDSDHAARFFDVLATLVTQDDSRGPRERRLIDPGVDLYQATDRRLNNSHVDISRDGNILYLHFSNAFKAYKEHERGQGNSSFSEGTLKDYLKKASYVDRGSDNKGYSRPWGRNRTRARVWKIHLEHESCPERAKELGEILVAIREQGERVSEECEIHPEVHPSYKA